MSKKISTKHRIYLKGILFGAFLERGFYYFIVDMISDTLEKYYHFPTDQVGKTKKICKYLSGIASIIGSIFADLLLGKFYALYLSLSIYNIGVGNLIYSNLRIWSQSYIYSIYIISVCGGLIRANIITYGFSKLVYKSNVWFFIISYYFYINVGIILSNILYNALLRTAGYSLTYIFFAICLHLTLIIIYSIESSFSKDIAIPAQHTKTTEREESDILKPSFIKICKLFIIVTFTAIGRYKSNSICDKLITDLDPVFQSTIYYKILFNTANPIIICILCSFFNHKVDKVLSKLFIGTIFSIVTCLVNILIISIQDKIKKTKKGIILYMILLIIYSFTEILINIPCYFLAYLLSPSSYESVSLGIVLLSQFASQFMIYVSTIITSVDIYQNICILLFSSLGLIFYILFFGFKSIKTSCNLNKKNPMYGK